MKGGKASMVLGLTKQASVKVALILSGSATGLVILRKL